MKVNLKQAIIPLTKPVLIFIASRFVVFLGILFSSYLPKTLVYLKTGFQALSTPLCVGMQDGIAALPSMDMYGLLTGRYLKA